jgi:hypothetical protein
MRADTRARDATTARAAAGRRGGLLVHGTLSSTVCLDRGTAEAAGLARGALAAHGALKAAGKLRLTVTVKPGEADAAAYSR